MINDITKNRSWLSPYFSDPLDYPVPKSFNNDFITLRESLSELIDSEKTIYSMAKIQESYSLSNQEIELLASVVRDIVMGYVFLGDMTAEIEKRLKVDEQKAGEIGDMLLSEIFAQNWEELQVWNVSQYRKHIQETEHSTQYPVRQDTKALVQGLTSSKEPIATATSFRANPQHAIIKSGYNPSQSRLKPFLTSKPAIAPKLQLANIKESPTSNQQSQKPSKTIDLRRK